MKFIKQTAWYGVPVTIAAIMAVAMLLVSPASKAFGVVNAIVLTDVNAISQVANLTETWTIDGTYSDGDAGDADLAGGDTLSITFPAGFQIPPAPTVVMTGASYATAADCSAIANTVGQTVTVTLAAGDADCVKNATGDIDFTLAGIKNPSAQLFAAAEFELDIENAAGAADDKVADAESGSTVRIVGASLSAGSSSIPADGASTVLITVNGSGVATNTAIGGLLSLTTDNGKFLTVPAPTNDAAGMWNGAPTVSTDGLTASQAIEDAIGAEPETVTLQAPSATGSATLQLRAVPAGGGASVLLAQLSITFITPAVVAGVPASGALASAGSATTLAPSAALVLTATYLDANGAVPLAGGTVTVTTNLGTMSAPSNGLCTLQACTGGAVLPDGTFLATLNHGGVAGAATVTFTRGTVILTKTITLTGGTVASVTLDLVRTNTSTSMAAKSIINDRQVSTGTTDELILVGRTLDSDGNAIIGTNLVTFEVTDAEGTAVNLLEDDSSGNATEATGAGNITYATTACSGGINTTTFKCTDNVEAGAGLLKAGAVAIVDVDKASTAPLTRGVYTVTVTYTQGTTVLTATGDFTVAGPVDTITVAGDAAIDIGASGSATATALDSDGNPIADRTTITFSTSSAVLATLSTTGAVATTAVTSGGDASMTTLGLSQGTAEVFAIAGGKNGSLQIVVGEVVEEPVVEEPVVEEPVVEEPTTPAADTPNVAPVPPAGGGLTQTVIGSTDVVAFAAAQDFVVASVIWFNLTSQANEFCLIEGAPTFAIDSCDGLTALSIVWATSQ